MMIVVSCASSSELLQRLLKRGNWYHVWKAHEGAISICAPFSNCSSRLSLASSSLKMSPMWHAFSRRGAEPKGRIKWRSARVFAQDYKPR